MLQLLGGGLVAVACLVVTRRRQADLPVAHTALAVATERAAKADAAARTIAAAAIAGQMLRNFGNQVMRNPNDETRMTNQ